MRPGEKKGIIKQLKEFFSKRPEFINRISQYGSNSILFVSSVTASMGLAGINLTFLSPHIANIIEGVIANFITEKKISKNKITDKQFEELIEKIRNRIEENTELTKEILSRFDSDEFKNALSEIKELRPLINNIYAEINRQLGEIEEQLVELNRVNITEIEIKLLKDKIAEPQFFRPEGPLWVDFEKGYVYRRPEVEEIKNRLKDENIVLITGAPASGKSVILKTIGYDFAKEGKSVYYLSLKSASLGKKLEIGKFKYGILIIDDIHLDIIFANEVAEHAERLKRDKKPGKIIMAGRKVNFEGADPQGKVPEMAVLRYLYKKSLEIKPADLVSSARNIIELYEKNRGIKMPEEIEKEVSTHNLWFLAYELKAYNSAIKTAEGLKEAAYKKIEKHIENLEGISDIYAAQVVLYITSFFYRFEIPILKRFFGKFGRDTKKMVDELCILGEVKENDGYISLHHSEIAEMYYKTFINSEYLKDNLKDIFEEYRDEDFPVILKNDPESQAKLFALYIKNYPEELPNIIWELRFNSDITISFYREINKIDKERFESSIKKSDNPGNIGWLIYSLRVTEYSKLNEVLNDVEKEIFEEKIMKWENPGDIGILIDSLRITEYSKLNEVLNDVEKEIFEEKIMKWENPLHIESLIYPLRKAGYDINKFNKEIFEEKIRKWSNLWDIGILIDSLRITEYSKLNEVLDDVGKEVFEEKIRKWYIPRDIGQLINSLKEAGYDINKFDKEVFEEKIRKWYIPGDIGQLINSLKEAGYSKLNEVLDDVGKEVFEEKIRKWYIPRDIGRLIDSLRETGYDKLNEVLDDVGKGEFEKKIRKWYSLFGNTFKDIKRLLGALEKANYPYIDELEEFARERGVEI